MGGQAITDELAIGGVNYYSFQTEVEKEYNIEFGCIEWRV